MFVSLFVFAAVVVVCFVCVCVCVGVGGGGVRVRACVRAYVLVFLLFFSGGGCEGVVTVVHMILPEHFISIINQQIA